MVSRKNIESFISSKKIGIVGVSSSPKKFGSMVFKDLKLKGYEVAPVNPKYTELQGEKCYKSVQELDDSFESILIILPVKSLEPVVNEAISKGVKQIWFQQKQFTKELVQLAESKNINVIYGECIYMWTNPKGIHKFHRSLRSLFGKLPK